MTAKQMYAVTTTIASEPSTCGPLTAMTGAIRQKTAMGVILMMPRMTTMKTS